MACGGRWRVREEVRALSSAQLLRAVRVTARRVAAAEAPTPALWDAYCERAYARDTARLERLLSAIVRKYAWVDELGPVGLQLYEQLVTVLCSDPLAGGGEALGASFGGGAALPDALAALLRAPRESLDLSERVHAACHAAVAWRNFRASRDALRLAEVLAELRRLLAFPPRDFRGKAAPRPPPPAPCTNWTRLVLPPVLSGHVSSDHSSQAALQRAVESHRTAALDEIRSGAEALLCDQHASFAAPADEIPPAVAVLLASIEALEVLPSDASRAAAARSPDGGGRASVATQRALTRVLRGSVRAHYATIWRGTVGDRAEMDVDGCIEVPRAPPRAPHTATISSMHGSQQRLQHMCFSARCVPPAAPTSRVCAQVVEAIPEEVAAEAQFYSPGFDAVYPPGVAAGVAALEYVRCCVECVGEVVDSFRTLSAQAHPPPPAPRTDRTRLVPPPVLIGHAASVSTKP